tara:strand:- start:2561 stop:2929 length:369 start_codon:yes stop_codon:yes gene_type:complete
MPSANNSSWSELICDGVSREDTKWWEGRNNYLDLIREMSEIDTPGYSIIGDKIVNKDIGVSQIDMGFQKGTGEKKNYYRKRKIPRGKKRNYPTKPKMSTIVQKWRKGERLNMNREKYEGTLS